MSEKYFDHILGSQLDKTSKQDEKITKRILDAYIKHQLVSEIRTNQRIGLKLLMKS